MRFKVTTRSILITLAVAALGIYSGVRTAEWLTNANAEAHAGITFRVGPSEGGVWTCTPIKGADGVPLSTLQTMCNEIVATQKAKP